jgi:hypothetical protein
VYLNWSCDFCGASALMVSAAGYVYCVACGLSNGSVLEV